MKNIYITAIIFILPIFTMGQNSKMDYANRSYTKHSLETAAKLYQKVVKKRPKYKPALTKIAECYYRMDDWHEAELWYSKLVIDMKRDNNPDFVRRYAQLLQINGKFEEAEEWFERLMEIAPKDKRGELFLNSCKIDTVEKYAEDFLDYYHLKKLPFNSEKDDFSPIITIDDNLMFTRGKTGKSYHWYVPVYEPFPLEIHQVKITPDNQNIYEFDKKSRQYRGFDKAERLASVTISLDEQQGVYMRYDKKYCGKNHPNLIPFKIFTAQRSRNRWNNQLPFDYNADEYTVTHPIFSEDGLTIYFASDMPGGHGGMDLYAINFEDGQWSEPKNLDSLNTIGDEVFPYIHYATGKFYFSSNGWGGMGGFDIFETASKNQKDWQKPKNLGAPINSRWNDYNIFINRDNNYGFISSDRKGGKGGVDIYGFERLD
jgi:tetratricopeptide (TPR) repeat protein